MYTRHEDNKTVTETIPALGFIQKLIVHIPEKHFKMLRYYGVYAKHHKQEKKLLVLEVYHKKLHYLNTIDFSALPILEPRIREILLKWISDRKSVV